MNAVEANYVDGKPRYLSDPSTSVFRIVSEDEFKAMSDTMIQDILRQQHIVVTGRKRSEYSFDLDGLETLAALDKPIIIHGKRLN